MNFEEMVPYIERELENFAGWKTSQNSINKTFFFKSHLEAVKFFEAVSLEAISEDNYPEIKVSFEKVEIIFVSEKDEDVFKNIDFIKKIEGFCDCYDLK